MVILGLMGGAKTDEPLDLSQILFKRLRIEGEVLCTTIWSSRVRRGRRPAAADLLLDRVTAGTALRSRSLEYQSHLLQDFSKKALDKVFARCNGQEGLDLVIHKVSFRSHEAAVEPLQAMHVLTEVDFALQVYDWKQATEAHEEMEQVTPPSLSSLARGLTCPPLFAQAKNIGKIVMTIS